MPRRKTHVPLNVLINNRLVGRLEKETSGAVSFRYDQSWLEWEHAFAASLSLPLRATTYRGAPVLAVFDNLLPDSVDIRRRVAERTGEGFAPDRCWALRRGQSHYVAGPGGDIVCGHVGEDEIYHCEPLLAGGEVIGVLYLQGQIESENRFRMNVLTENIASALVNHRLQRSLREQTIRDPLTGLFNRRYMEETLKLEIARASRAGTPLSLVMCDVDHFKRFNDEFGHDAGDAVLQVVAAEMRSRFRDGDVVCRFGGEEFTIIAPGTTADALAGRVEVVRRAIAELTVRHGSRSLGSTSMSFGIATWSPTMARDGSTLIQAADMALYQSKREGRNRATISLIAA